MTVSLRTFQQTVQKTIRMLYRDPLVHLVVDFLVKHCNVEAFSFARKHQIEGKNKQVQTVLN